MLFACGRVSPLPYVVTLSISQLPAAMRMIGDTSLATVNRHNVNIDDEMMGDRRWAGPTGLESATSRRDRPGVAATRGHTGDGFRRTC